MTGGPWVLGIDFGTSFSVVAARVEGRAPEVIEVDGERRVPSVVYVGADGRVVVGRAAEELGVADPGRLVRAPKARLGDAAPVVIGQTAYPVVSLVAEILAHLYAAALAYHEVPPVASHLAFPATWGSARQAQLRRAAELAGLPGVALVAEPVAAAVGFAAEAQREKGSTVLVYDLGGGTFDVAALRQSADGPQVVGRPMGTGEVGGELFDELVMDTLGAQLVPQEWEQLQVGADPNWRRAAAGLRREARRVKEALATHASIDAVVPLPSGLAHASVTREMLEGVLAPYVDDTVSMSRQVARTVDGRIDEVFLAGGSSRLPMVEAAVRSTFPDATVSRRGDPKAVVALGATYAQAVVAQPLLERGSDPAGPLTPAGQRTTAAVRSEQPGRVAVSVGAGPGGAGSTRQAVAAVPPPVDRPPRVDRSGSARRRPPGWVLAVVGLAVAGLIGAAVWAVGGDDTADPQPTTTLGLSTTTVDTATTTTAPATTTTVAAPPLLTFLGERSDVSSFLALGGGDPASALDLPVDGWTMFVPVDGAFDKLPEQDRNVLASDLFRAALLAGHVISGTFTVAELQEAGGDIDSLQADAPIGITTFTDGTMRLNGGGTVLQADVEVEGGIVHLVDTVLVHPNLQDDVDEFIRATRPTTTTRPPSDPVDPGGGGGGGGGTSGASIGGGGSFQYNGGGYARLTIGVNTSGFDQFEYAEITGITQTSGVSAEMLAFDCCTAVGNGARSVAVDFRSFAVGTSTWRISFRRTTGAGGPAVGSVTVTVNATAPA